MGFTWRKMRSSESHEADDSEAMWLLAFAFVSGQTGWPTGRNNNWYGQGRKRRIQMYGLSEGIMFRDSEVFCPENEGFRCER